MSPPRDWVVVMMDEAIDAALVAIPRVEPAATPAEPFDELYRRTVGIMTQVAWALVGDRRIAEEVAHDAYAAVYQRDGRLERPEAYLRVCVVNGCKRHLRRTAKVKQLVDGMAASELEGVVEHGYDHLLELVRRLPARHREVVVLRYQLGLTEPEIADTLAIPVGSVKSRLHRAKARLREELER